MVDTIRDLCKKNRTSIKALEKQLGFGNGTIRRWDDHTPGGDKVQKVAECFGVSVEYLLTGENEKPATISDDGFSEVDEVFRKLSPENREKLLELARLYLDAQHNQ